MVLNLIIYLVENDLISYFDMNSDTIIDIFLEFIENKSPLADQEIAQNILLSTLNSKPMREDMLSNLSLEAYLNFYASLSITEDRFYTAENPLYLQEEVVHPKLMR